MLALKSLTRILPTFKALSYPIPKIYFATVPKDIKEQQKPKITSERKQYEPEEVRTFIKKILEENPVMLFMKGTPSNPVCGFSYKAVQILKALGCDFASANILTSEAVRLGLKELYDWQTFPQLYIKGQLIGGCDIMLQLYESGELKKMLEDAHAIHHDEDESKESKNNEETKKSNPK